MLYLHLPSTAPSLTVQLLPPLVTGNSGDDSIELHCTAVTTKDIISDSYEFIWSKNGVTMDQLNIENVVCRCCILLDYGYFFVTQIITNNSTSSTLYINAIDTNATVHNGMYTCQVTLAIAEEDKFSQFSNKSRVAFSGTVV